MIEQQLIASLLLWSLLSLGTGVFGLYARTGEFWRSFWFMSALWGLIDGGIAWFGLVSRSHQVVELLPILRFNAGLDVLYIVAGAVLLTRSKPLPRGFGMAVFIQGVFLLGFDSYLCWKCASAIA